VNRRDFSAQVIAASLGAVALSLPQRAAAQGAAPVEGAQFTRLEPSVPPQIAGKIEVLEFFSYACPHCNAFEPTLDAWVKKLPADVAFQRVPVPFLMNAESFQRTYYALQTLGQLDVLQRKVFTAVHVEHARLDKPADIAALVAKNGVDATKFLDVFNSFSVANSVSKAKRMTAAFRIDGVPTLAVQGRYLTSPGQAGGPEGALAVADFLIQRARKG
jgi:thiol:disulfide interchange protein DsbA